MLTRLLTLPRLLFALTCGLVFYCGLVLAEDICDIAIAAELCDCERPGASTGTCADVVKICDGQSQAHCNVANEVKTDFPTSCRYAQWENCSEELMECQRTCHCKWDGSCSIDDTKVKGPWTSANKKVSEVCPPL
jgi:hypothetical protein